MKTAGRIAVIGLALAGAILAFSDPLMLLFFSAYMAVGAFVAIRRPDNLIGWLLIAIAFGFIATTAVPDVDIAALQRGDASFRDDLIAWLGGWAGLGVFIAFLALAVLVPNGRLPEHGRRTSIALLLTGIAVLLLTAFAPIIPVTIADAVSSVEVRNPFAILPQQPIWRMLPIKEAEFPIVVVLLVVAVGRLVLRYRRSRGVEHLQLRWLVAAIVFVLFALIFGLVSTALVGDGIGGIAWVPAIVAYPTIPLAVGVAVMRYRLLEIDRIISRTLSYAVVTAILGGVFVGVILLAQTMLQGVVGRGGIPVAISTLVVFAIFQPVLRRVRRVVDRRFDRARYDGERTANAFAERLRRETDMERVTGDLRVTVANAVAPAGLDIWLRVGRDER